MDESIQNEEQAKCDIRDFGRLKAERAPWENTFRAIDERFPSGAGGFVQKSPGGIRGGANFDSTHITALARFAAAGVAITTPEEKLYIRPRFADPALNRLRDVQLWCEEAGRRLYDIRHAPHTGFSVSANEDWDQLGRYGTSPVWSEARDGVRGVRRGGLFYRCLHLSSTYIDIDYSGIVNLCVRYMVKTADQLEDQFGREALTPKMIEALDDKKGTTEFEVIHWIGPNRDYDAEPMDWRRFPVASRYLALGEKLYVRRRGFHSMPISVSRHVTSAGEKYGRSPGIHMLPNIEGANAMRRTTLRAGHKAVDPALVFNDDNGITKIATKPGGLTAGLMDENGRILVGRMPGGEAALPYAREDLNDEREIIRTEFLEDFYKILTDPNSRMTTTEVLEVMAKQGILVRPFAGRYAMEKQYPMTNRDLELALDAGQIAPLPPAVVEAGAWPIIDYENELAAMARAQETSKTMRFNEVLTGLANASKDGAILDWLNEDAMVPGMAEEIGVRPSYVRSPQEVQAIRAARQQQQQMTEQSQAALQNAQAYAAMAKGNQLAAA
ncbi:portal protein [Novosphingobium sp. FKTRR1]|uniref:portal protein n=1 Tax=Novosphingobium sp. FKTRR1 TaxID=2879118 RepID=UPI001CF070C2|nr:portal protein [Novosphingobium sp. FKTRR1]